MAKIKAFIIPILFKNTYLILQISIQYYKINKYNQKLIKFAKYSKNKEQKSN